MPDDLFAAQPDHDRQRLREAGWVEVQRWNQCYWHTPGQPDDLLPLAEAVKRLEREQKERP